ncbi:hypothetical protein KCP78_02790 [Salmonella enterica subsp. enterica]|nr:hypothetical protein KCP78_02790 [Salmonella enterica subsp. enterica]
MIGQYNWQQVLVFTRHRHGANHLAEQLNKDGISAARRSTVINRRRTYPASAGRF